MGEETHRRCGIKRSGSTADRSCGAAKRVGCTDSDRIRAVGEGGRAKGCGEKRVGLRALTNGRGTGGIGQRAIADGGGVCLAGGC